MKTALRLVIGFTVLISFSLYLLETHLRDLCNQYRGGAYLKDWLVQRGSSQSPLMSDIIPDDKIIVMAKLEEGPTGWVQEQLPEYVPSFSFEPHLQYPTLTLDASPKAGNTPSTSSTPPHTPEATATSS